jgi:hypothetical protein
MGHPTYLYMYFVKTWIMCISVLQLKADWRAVDSPKKRNQRIRFVRFLLFTANKTNSFIRFLGESTASPNCFQFYLFNSISFFLFDKFEWICLLWPIYATHYITNFRKSIGIDGLEESWIKKRRWKKMKKGWKKLNGQLYLHVAASEKAWKCGGDKKTWRWLPVCVPPQGPNGSGPAE